MEGQGTSLVGQVPVFVRALAVAHGVLSLADPSPPRGFPNQDTGSAASRLPLRYKLPALLCKTLFKTLQH